MMHLKVEHRGADGAVLQLRYGTATRSRSEPILNEEVTLFGSGE
jgi:hypothetical protein